MSEEGAIVCARVLVIAPLQWSLAPMSEEGARSAPSPNAPKALQWSLAPMSEEGGRCRCAGRSMTAGFNGASLQ